MLFRQAQVFLGSNNLLDESTETATHWPPSNFAAINARNNVRIMLQHSRWESKWYWSVRGAIRVEPLCKGPIRVTPAIPPCYGPLNQLRWTYLSRTHLFWTHLPCLHLWWTRHTAPKPTQTGQTPLNGPPVKDLTCDQTAIATTKISTLKFTLCVD